GSAAARSQGLCLPSPKRCVCLANRVRIALDSAAVGGRATQQRKAYVARSGLVEPASFRVRRARARAHSRKIGSLSDVRACKGVFDRERRTHEKSPFGA